MGNNIAAKFAALRFSTIKAAAAGRSTLNSLSPVEREFYDDLAANIDTAMGRAFDPASLAENYKIGAAGLKAVGQVAADLLKVNFRHCGRGDNKGLWTLTAKKEKAAS